MEERILKAGKIFERWVTFQMGKKGLMDKVPSVSYVMDEILSYNGTKSVLSGLDRQELIRSIFTAYNLLTGDDDVSAVKKSKTISDISVVEREGESYLPKDECSECGGTGDVSCEECYGEGAIDCRECEGSGYKQCPECDGSDEECDNCGGDGEVSCSGCHGSGTESCPECYGSGEKTCQECSGMGEVEADYGDEVIEVSYFSIVTQSEDLVNEINNNLDSDDEIKNFEEIIDKYQSEVLKLDTFSDTIHFSNDWGVDESVDYKLENLITPYYNFTVKRDTITSLF